MKYLIIALIIAALVSPLMVLKPSRRQKRILSLREEASTRGLQVQVVADTIADKYGRRPSAVRYMLPWTAQHLQAMDGTHWLLVRGGRGNQVSPWDGWSWFKNAAPVAAYPHIGVVLASLPQTVNGLCSNAQGVGVYWQETGGLEEVEKIAQNLRRFARSIC